jgi:sugar lactone lactonase YvrE
MSISVNPRPLGQVRDDVKCVIPGSDFLGEGPHWSPETGLLHWVDILAPAIIVGDPSTGERKSTPMPELVGVTVPKKSGGFLAATETGIKAVEDGGKLIRTLAEPEADKPGNRFNDGKCDRNGRFWFGSLAINTAPGQGALWRYDPDGALHKMDEGFHVSNGLGWSPDDTRFYFTDSGKRTIYRYDYDAGSGEIGNRKVFAVVQSGTPDGLTVDAEGFVWSAHWDGWCVTRYDPDGQVERVINLPVPRPTSCIYGGPDFTTLYVTTARIRLSAQQLVEAPLSGSIFAIATGIRGIPETIFGG